MGVSTWAEGIIHIYGLYIRAHAYVHDYSIRSHSLFYIQF